MSNPELGGVNGVNGVKRGKSHQNLTAAQVGGGPLFLCFWTPLIGWRLGQKSYYHAKVYFHAKVKGFRDSIKRKGKKE